MSTLYLPNTTVTTITASAAAEGSLATTGNSTNASLISGSAAAGISLLIIHKGIAPTYPAFTDRASRSSDVLITFTLPTNAGFTAIGLVDNAYRVLIGRCLTSFTATQSGTASWFLLCRSGTTSMTNKGNLIGSIGLTGSGEDLELPSLDIISGASYQCAGFYINFPQIQNVP